MDANNRQWVLTSVPRGLVKESDFEWREAPRPPVPEGQALVRNIYLSLDPANRVWMNGAETYMAPLKTGSVMRGGTIGVVEESRYDGLRPGDLVQGSGGWQLYSVVEARDWSKLPPGRQVPLTAYFGLFGHIGLTAYFGLLDVGKPKAGETLVVSAAAGAVGSLAGQIGKIQGCRVVGIAGSDEKCRWITEELGFDAAINYKTGPVREALKRHCPDGIDIYFENVGGEILEAVLSLINQRARIPVCGMISQYNAAEPAPGPRNLSVLIMKRARMEGFIVLDYLARSREAVTELARWYAEGKLKYRVDVVQGLENAPRAINKLFDGSNQGKLIVQVSPEPV